MGGSARGEKRRGGEVSGQHVAICFVITAFAKNISVNEKYFLFVTIV